MHTPHRDKARGTRRTLELVAASGIDPGRVAVDHLNEVTVGLVSGTGCWMGFSIYPETKMSPPRMVEILQPARPPNACWSTRPPTGASPTRC